MHEKSISLKVGFVACTVPSNSMDRLLSDAEVLCGLWLFILGVSNTPPTCRVSVRPFGSSWLLPWIHYPRHPAASVTRKIGRLGHVMYDITTGTTTQGIA